MKREIGCIILAITVFCAIISVSAAGPGDHFQNISGGRGHALAIKDDGSLWAWGYLSESPLNPAPVKIMDGAVQAAAGFNHALAIKNDGSLWAWGDNTFGQLGDGTKESKRNPVKVMDDVIQVAAGSDHSLVIRNDGSLWTWGRNTWGQLGRSSDGNDDNGVVPAMVMDGVVCVAAGSWHTMVIKSDASLWAWGTNWGGHLGDGTTVDRHDPVKIMDDVIQVAAGNAVTAALKGDGCLWTWGLNYMGEIGDGTTETRLNPVKIMDNVVCISMGDYHVMAIKNDGSLWAWGNNVSGQLGDGTYTNRLSPVKIMDGVCYISGGSFNSLAIKVDGSLWSWGHEGGAIGDGTIFGKRPSPIKIMDGMRVPSKTGDILGDVLHTDITAYINGSYIRSYNIGQSMYVSAEDLANYGFDVQWDGGSRALRVERNKNKFIISIPKETNNLVPWQFLFHYVYTDIRTFLSGERAVGFAINGQTLVDFDELARYGTMVWDGQAREIRLLLD